MKHVRYGLILPSCRYKKWFLTRVCKFFVFRDRNHNLEKVPKNTEIIQITAKILSQGKMLILFKLNVIDIPLRGCAEWAELRRSGGSCYGLSRMQIRMRCALFLIDQQIGKNKPLSVWTQRTFLQQSTEDAVSRANFSRHGNKGSNTDFQTFQQKRKMAKNYILIIFSFPVEMWQDSPAPFMASLSFWTSASGLKPAASVTVPRVPICSWNNNQMCVLHMCVFELHCAERLQATQHNKLYNRKVASQ